MFQVDDLCCFLFIKVCVEDQLFNGLTDVKRTAENLTKKGLYNLVQRESEYMRFSLIYYWKTYDASYLDLDDKRDCQLAT